MDEELIRPAVKGIPEYVPGKTPKEPGVIKLASNENPFGPSPKALEAIAKESKNLQIYPDQKSILLREALAKKLNIADDCIICGNGSDDIMLILGATYLNPGDEVIIFEPFYDAYVPDVVMAGGVPRYVRLYPPSALSPQPSAFGL